MSIEAGSIKNENIHVERSRDSAEGVKISPCVLFRLDHLLSLGKGRQ